MSSVSSMKNKLCKTWGVTSIKHLVELSASHGGIEIVEECLRLCPRLRCRDLDTALLKATCNNEVEIIKLLLERGVFNIQEPMALATKRGYLEAAHLIHNKIIERYDISMMQARKAKQFEKVKEMAEEKAKMMKEYQERAAFLAN